MTELTHYYIIKRENKNEFLTVDYQGNFSWNKNLNVAEDFSTEKKADKFTRLLTSYLEENEEAQVKKVSSYFDGREFTIRLV